MNTKRLTTCVSALVAMAVLAPLPARAQEAPPAAGTPKDITLPAPHTFTLPNGLEVKLLQYGTVPKAFVQLVTRTGRVDEGADETWLSGVMADLMREGTTTRTGEQIAERAASLGGALNVGAGNDETTVGGDVLAEFAPDMVRLVADVARNPSFPESQLARIKANRLRNLAISRSQPQTLAFERFQNVLYGEHPYGIMFPAEQALQGYTIEQVRGFYDRSFGAARSRLYVVGRFDAAAVEAAARAAFGDWAAGTTAAPVIPQSSPQPAIHIIDRPGAVQSSIYIGLPVVDMSHPDYMKLLVTNTLLGGAFSSRITLNIREDKGYTYSPFSMISSRYRTAFWAQVADVTTAVTGPAITEIFREIDRLATEPPDAAELRGIQNYVAGSFTLSSSSRFGLLGQLRTLDLQGLPQEWFTTYVRNAHAVTPADVRDVTRRHLDRSRMVIVIVGDRAQILEQVSPFGSVVTE